jgi:hypothetical protein
MGRVDPTKEATLKIEIRMAIAQDPMISIRRLQKILGDKGFRTYEGNPVHKDYILKLVHRVKEEAVKTLDREQINERIALTRERFNVAFQRLFKIAFWNIDYLGEGIDQPSNAEQIYALNTILKMDLALLQGEMDAGVFDRKLGSIEHQIRNRPLDEETNAMIKDAAKRWQALMPGQNGENKVSQSS